MAKGFDSSAAYLAVYKDVMSVSFNGDLDLNNGLASRLLRAMGYKVTEDSNGEMPLAAAKEGIERARATVSSEDRPYLDMLAQVVQDVEASGSDTLTWS